MKNKSLLAFAIAGCFALVMVLFGTSKTTADTIMPPNIENCIAYNVDASGGEDFNFHFNDYACLFSNAYRHYNCSQPVANISKKNYHWCKDQRLFIRQLARSNC